MNTYFQKTLENKDNIWSIYWSFTILKNNGLCISPFKNLIKTLVLMAPVLQKDILHLRLRKR